jgi:N-acetyltransferase
MFTGRYVSLEPLTTNHAAEITAALGSDRTSYRWATVPVDANDVIATISARLALQDAGSWIPFVQRRTSDRAIVGMTNYLVLERWNGADHHPTSVEIGGTWLNPSAQRSPVNTEAKFLLLQNAFETWQVQRVQVKTDERNDASRAAIERLGATFEGILRNFQPGQGENGTGSPRNTAMFSIIASEWPAVKAGLIAKLDR